MRTWLLVLLGLLLSSDVTAQPAESVNGVVLTLDEAVQIALVNNLLIRNQRLDLENAGALVREGYGNLYPQVDLTSSYTRNVRSVNPFAGSQAGGFFQTLGFIDWLAYNEQARTDTDPGSNPISLPDFLLRQQEGLNEAGIVLESSDNPFSVPNTYRSGIAVTQALFDARVLFGATGAAKWLEPFTEAGITRQEQILINDVKSAFYGSLLTLEQVRVLDMSVMRADRTRQELARQVEAGTAPKFQRLSAEVELANLQTRFVEAENASAASLDGLKLLVGIPVDQPLKLRGDLEAELESGFLPVTVDDAAEAAIMNRPDLEQSRIGIELERIQLQVARAEFMPDLSAFLNLNYVGTVPDNRVIVSTDPFDPFSYSSTENGYFSSSYWDWDLNVGFRLQWNLFNGFASKSRIQQRKIAIQKATLDQEYLMRNIRVEVERSIRDVIAARQRLRSQEQNVGRAELNYSFVETRLREGVASPIELREASDQLDQSRLNYLQAVHDFLVAKSAYETAIGTPVS